MDIILLLLACVGLTIILVDSKIMEKFRNFVSRVKFFKDLISCSMCTGFWVGLYFAIVLILYLTFPQFKPIYYILTIPFASSFLSWICERASVIIDIKAYNDEKDE